jgi:hypothetical protein
MFYVSYVTRLCEAINETVGWSSRLPPDIQMMIACCQWIVITIITISCGLIRLDPLSISSHRLTSRSPATVYIHLIVLLLSFKVFDAESFRFSLVNDYVSAVTSFC